MSLQYQVLWFHADASPIGVFDSINRIDLAYAEAAIGAMTLVVPETGLTPENFSVDQILEFWRGEQGNLYREGERVWFIRSWEFSDGYVTIKAVDQNDLLNARVIAYAANTAYTDKTDNADDMMKAFVRENLGSSATDSTRRLSAISIQPDAGAAPSVDKACSREKLLSVLRSLAKSSIEKGTYLTFDLVCTGPGLFDFRTYTGQRGADHGASGLSPLTFSIGAGNLSKVVFREDHSDEETFCYAGGLGQESNRVVVGVAGAGATSSPWNRREFFWDGRSTYDTAILTNEAQSELRARRARRSIEATVQQTAGFRYGIEYNYGDLVAVYSHGYTVDCRLSTVRITVDSKGKEIIDLKLRGEW